MASRDCKLTKHAIGLKTCMKIDKDLTARLSKNGNDVDGAKELLALGFPAIVPVLPHLFQWLETGGPLVESVIQPFFATLGAPARDLACKALEAEVKPALKYRLVRYVLLSKKCSQVNTLSSCPEPSC